MGLGKTLQTISILGFMQKYSCAIHLAWQPRCSELESAKQPRPHRHRFHGISGPHVVVVPKSTLSNWIREINRWSAHLLTVVSTANVDISLSLPRRCPTLRAIKFHGTKDERAELIKTGQCPLRTPTVTLPFTSACLHTRSELVAGRLASERTFDICVTRQALDLGEGGRARFFFFVNEY